MQNWKLMSRAVPFGDYIRLAGYNLHVHGESSAVANSFEDLSARGADNDYITGTSGVQLVFRSTSAQDAAAGTGARTVALTYLDENWDRQIETVTLSGTTPVATTATDILRVCELEVMTVGTNGSPVGTIILTEVGGVTKRYLVLRPGDNHSRCGYFYVPRDTAYFITGVNAGTTSTDTNLMQIRLYMERRESATSDPIEGFYNLVSFKSASKVFDLDAPIMIGEKCRVRVKAISATTGAGYCELRGYFAPAHQTPT